MIMITSVRRVSEIKVLMSELPYIVFFKEKVQLRPHLTFLPKVVIQFHVNQAIFLPVFFPKPHKNSEEW